MPADATIQKMKDSLLDIWGDIYKPDGYKDSKISDFFDLEFTFLAHKKYQKDEFAKGTKELRGKFESGNLFVSSAGEHEEVVPIDGLGIFLKQSWDVIRNNKELNLPD